MLLAARFADGTLAPCDFPEIHRGLRDRRPSVERIAFFQNSHGGFWAGDPTAPQFVTWPNVDALAWLLRLLRAPGTAVVLSAPHVRSCRQALGRAVDALGRIDARITDELHPHGHFRDRVSFEQLHGAVRARYAPTGRVAWLTDLRGPLAPLEPVSCEALTIDQPEICP
ncbi:MAG: hypothetical protein AB7P99_06895 [Vicinamibacterales bacterium]